MTYSNNTAFETASVVTSAPRVTDIAAALPREARDEFRESRYASTFPERARRTGAGQTAVHWANAYLSNRVLLEEASVGATVLGEVVTNAKEIGRLRREPVTPAGLLTGISRADEARLIRLLDCNWNFASGFLLLTEGDRLARFEELAAKYDSSHRLRAQITGRAKSPYMWAHVPDFENFLMFLFSTDDLTIRDITRFMAAARAMNPGAGFEAALALSQSATVEEAEEYAKLGLPLEYALA